MTDPETRFQEMIRKLKTGDYRITPQRIAILKILAASRLHPSAEQIHEEVKINFPTTSMATVYKTMIVLKGLGEVIEISLGVGGNRYDGNPVPHPHLICVECKKIVDVRPDSFESLAGEVAKHSGFEIINHRLDFFGKCPECR